jgi:hypothetical protein
MCRSHIYINWIYKMFFTSLMKTCNVVANDSEVTQRTFKYFCFSVDKERNMNRLHDISVAVRLNTGFCCYILKFFGGLILYVWRHIQWKLWLWFSNMNSILCLVNVLWLFLYSQGFVFIILYHIVVFRSKVNNSLNWC